MSETTARIRWEDVPVGGGDVYVIASKGYVGTIEEPAFRIYTPDEVHDNWLLSVRLTGGSKFIYASDPDKLKAEAERWLTEFTSSLGAVFPDTLREVIKMERDAQDGLAAEHAEYGRDARSEQCYAEVKTLDWVLALMDRITSPAPVGAGTKE